MIRKILIKSNINLFIENHLLELFKMKILITEVPEKHPKLVLMFERTTGKHAVYHNKITKQFIHWLRHEIKYKNLICNICGKKFDSKKGLISHRRWHDLPEYKEYQENYKKKMIDVNKGENHWNYGKRGEGTPMYGKHHTDEAKKKIGNGTFKENASIDSKHEWIRKYFPQKEICDDKCEICGEFNSNLDLARFLHIDVRNIENPMIDYLYLCPRKAKNSKNTCHRIYDKLSDEQKKELLAGAITREEKLKRVREFVLKIKN